MLTRSGQCESGGIAKFNYLNSVDELQRLESQIVETSQQLTATTGQAARQVSANSRQILTLEAQLTALQEQQRNLTLKAQQARGSLQSFCGAWQCHWQWCRSDAHCSGWRWFKGQGVSSQQRAGFHQRWNARENGCFVVPPGEYGYLKGRVKDIGADALESTDQQSADRQRANTFPMTIELTDNQDKLAILERLAPGMQVSANIIVRQRPVITLFTEVFTIKKRKSRKTFHLVYF